ncbi:hypothetical protein HanXRQr2_Chr10g0427401 [Helianthus annuus]|uniref:Uncharacterized protein n=1 Tax=Helianthus annuus TaxID=4232 RepID=A0A9K3N336_HELAN|nr:hypothetical protein HanXRQr2_Chr10g0427401 [Helianthus annuus]KAJ0512899.1 hypothetical protein HanHA300_Chr10g0351371 [Helianthus annuus]KAJ0529021.1 hypothetical protein HanHA89_Chr10g0373031 [Helianthus annuus]
MLTNIKNAAIQPSNKNPSRNCDISSKAFFVFYLVVANGRLHNGLTGQNGSIPWWQMGRLGNGLTGQNGSIPAGFNTFARW